MNIGITEEGYLIIEAHGGIIGKWIGSNGIRPEEGWDVENSGTPLCLIATGYFINIGAEEYWPIVIECTKDVAYVQP